MSDQQIQSNDAVNPVQEKNSDGVWDGFAWGVAGGAVEAAIQDQIQQNENMLFSHANQTIGATATPMSGKARAVMAGATMLSGGLIGMGTDALINNND